MTRRVALLRGINVGGHHRVPMAELREVVADAGASTVTTVIQSGNVCFDHDGDDAEVLASLLDGFESRFGFVVSMTLRTTDELAAALAAHPWEPGPVEPKLHHIMFLAQPAPADADQRLRERVDDEDMAVIGSEVHVRYPSGSARSRFGVDWVDRRLGTTATARNIPTCEKILATLAGG